MEDVRSVVGELARDISLLTMTTRQGSPVASYVLDATRFLRSFGTRYVGFDRPQITLIVHQHEQFWSDLKDSGNSSQTTDEDEGSR